MAPRTAGWHTSSTKRSSCERRSTTARRHRPGHHGTRLASPRTANPPAPRRHDTRRRWLIRPPEAPRSAPHCPEYARSGRPNRGIAARADPIFACRSRSAMRRRSRSTARHWRSASSAGGSRHATCVVALSKPWPSQIANHARVGVVVQPAPREATRMKRSRYSSHQPSGSRSGAWSRTSDSYRFGTSVPTVQGSPPMDSPIHSAGSVDATAPSDAPRIAPAGSHTDVERPRSVLRHANECRAPKSTSSRQHRHRSRTPRWRIAVRSPLVV